MSGAKTLCKGHTTKGNPCQNFPQRGKEYCRYHDLEAEIAKEQHRVKTFFEKHKEGIIGFLGGAVTDPIVSDIYEFVKEQLGMKYLVPLIPDREPLSTELRFGMSKDNVYRLLGKPSYHWDSPFIQWRLLDDHEKHELEEVGRKKRYRLHGYETALELYEVGDYQLFIRYGLFYSPRTGTRKDEYVVSIEFRTFPEYDSIMFPYARWTEQDPPEWWLFGKPIGIKRTR